LPLFHLHRPFSKIVITIIDLWNRPLVFHNNALASPKMRFMRICPLTDATPVIT